jgi:hypothetical protein
MKQDIGFLLLQLTNNSAYDGILQVAQKIAENNPRQQTIIFNSYCEKVNLYDLPVLHISQAQFFVGNLFIFDLSGVILTKKFPNIDKRFFYVNNAPWTQQPQTKYENWSSLYNQNSLNFIAQNEQLYDLYNICWKQPIGIAKEFDYETIQQYL